jgi:hypothetical protein
MTESSLRAAERVLAATRGGGRLRLSLREVLRQWEDHATVFRLDVDASAGGPGTVIMKRASNFAPYDPGRGDGPAWYLFNEWAALEFLSRLDVEPRVAPEFLGGDRDAGVILYEDLGAGDSLADVLLGADAGRAERAVVAHSAALGRMHAATTGRARIYRALRDGLGPDDPEQRGSSGIAVRQFIAECQSIGLPIADAVRVELDWAWSVVEAPGAFSALVHGDACPDNDRVLEDRVAIFDFTWAEYGHALKDGLYGSVPFPTCWCVNRLPGPLADQALHAYRQELAVGCRAAEDDAQWDAAVAANAARWLVQTSVGSLAISVVRPMTSGADLSAAWGVSTHAQRLALRLPIFARLMERLDRLPALRALALAIMERLALDESAMPLYPAFRHA